ncbi:MAG: aminotransferase class V-fold PLP-dependent enzyme, partial [Actinobacteria bacterium]|nr:aminotransferase class V-fold PLP-dependent enzyme [Actinomycetota bacterium]
FEYGTRDCMLLHGLLITIELYEKWIWQMKDGRIKELAEYLRENLSKIPKCVIHTPIEWEKSSGNTTFSMKGYSLGELSGYLSRDWHIYTRGVGELDGTRISTCHFNRYDEVNKLVMALKAM